MESSKVEAKEYTYIINSHGSIVTSVEGDVKKYMAISIPKNVELFTYTRIGEKLYTACSKNNLICDNLDKFKDSTDLIVTPTHKYKYKQDAKNIFPEVILKPDSESVLTFYSGIIHCIPHIHRTTKSKEIIYNMDAANILGCSDDSIGKYYEHAKTKDKHKLYDTNQKYSKYYKELLEKPENKREPALKNINKCGPILLSEAIKLIQDHCSKTYSEDYERCTIKIHLSCCLGEMDIESYEEDSKFFFDLSEKERKENIIKTRDSDNALMGEPPPFPLSEAELQRLYYYKVDFYKLNAKSKINNDLYTNNLEEFAKNLDYDNTVDTKNTRSFLIINNGIHVKLIISEESLLLKYAYDENKIYYFIMLHEAIIRFEKYLLDWRKSFSDLPTEISLDVTEFKEPNVTTIFNKLVSFIIDNNIKSLYVYKYYNIQVYLLHDQYLENSEREYNAIIDAVISRLYNNLSKTLVFNTVTFFEIHLKLSQLSEVTGTDDELFKLVSKQVIKEIMKKTLEKAKKEEKEEKEEKATTDVLPKDCGNNIKKTYKKIYNKSKKSKKFKKFRGKYTRRPIKKHIRRHRRIHRVIL